MIWQILQSVLINPKIKQKRVELSRLSRFVKICQDAVKICRDAVEICREISTRNLDEKIQKSMHFSIEIETNCREMPKFSDLDEFLDLDRDFLVWTLMSRLNQEISTEISWSSRLTFENRQDYPSRRDWYFFGVEIESLDRDHVETNRDPQAYKNIHFIKA